MFDCRLQDNLEKPSVNKDLEAKWTSVLFRKAEELVLDNSIIKQLDSKMFKSLVCTIFTTKFTRRLKHGTQHVCLRDVKWRDQPVNETSCCKQFTCRQLDNGDTEYVFIANCYTPIKLIKSSNGVHISVLGKTVAERCKDDLHFLMRAVVNTKLCKCRKSGACSILLSCFTKADICTSCKKQQSMAVLRDSTNKRQGWFFSEE